MKIKPLLALVLLFIFNVHGQSQSQSLKDYGEEQQEAIIRIVSDIATQLRPAYGPACDADLKLHPCAQWKTHLDELLGIAEKFVPKQTGLYRQEPAAGKGMQFDSLRAGVWKAAQKMKRLLPYVPKRADRRSLLRSLRELEARGCANCDPRL